MDTHIVTTSSYIIPVRNYHLDGFGHVNNARYLEFLEEGSWDYLDKHPKAKAMLETLQREGIIHVVVNNHCDYKASASSGDVLRVETRLLKTTKNSYTWSKEIYEERTGKLIVQATSTCVFIYKNTGRVAPDDVTSAVWA